MASNSLNSRAILFGALVLLCCSLRAQEIRCNYRSGSISHISTEYEALRIGADSAWVRLEKAGFQEGCIYLLYINLEQAAPVVAPKGVKMALNLNKGGIIRTEQIGEDSPTKPKLENGLYCNRLKYALDPRDMEKILGGVRSVDIVTGWNPDDYLQATFKDNEFSALLGRHFAAIEAGEGGTITLSAELAAYSDNLESILATTKPIVARGEKRIYNVILSYLYYKNSNTDDIDLAFQIGTEDSYRIPLDAEVVFVLGDGSLLTLPQTRDETNLVYVYPSMSDIRRIIKGVKEIRIPYSKGAEGGQGVLGDTFLPGEGFAEAVNAQYQTLISVSPR
ncbi:MAG: hypothetical protein II652_04835 [Bacteroidales bacterium]|nr:hypothetical protein [Bacteroidales bacterium]